MRIRALLAAGALLVLGGAEAAQAIEGPRAVRHIRKLVAEDCRSYPGFDCLDWEVTRCYKISWRKVRCSAWQQYSHNGNWRECRFKVAAVEERWRNWVRLHFGRVRCFSESGKEIR